jgi:acetyl-CoA carboxylase / biotin carboxylase 1
MPYLFVSLFLGFDDSFPAEEILSFVSNQTDSIVDGSERAAFATLTTPLSQTLFQYTKSKLAGIPGSERALQSFLTILRKWVSMERWFCDGKTYADAVDNLRKANKDDSAAVLSVCRAHEQLLATSEIVLRIISIIGDSTRVDFQGGAPSSIGKRVSIVAGAESLPLALPIVAEIGSMGSSDKYYEVALRARKLLMQESMPSLEQRKQKVINAAKALSSTNEAKIPREVEVLIADNIPMSDVMFPLLYMFRSSSEEVGLLELYLRNLYRPYTIKDLEKDIGKRLVRFTFLNKPSETAVNVDSSVNSMTDLSRIVSSGSLTMLSDSSEKSSVERKVQISDKIPRTTLRTGVCAVVEKLEDLSIPDHFESLLSAFPQHVGSMTNSESGPANVLYFVLLDTVVSTDELSNDEDAARCEHVLNSYKMQLALAGIRRVTFVFCQQGQDELQDNIPALFTFRSPEFREDSLYRRIDPSLSMHLHLHRVAANFKIRSLGSRHTSTCHVHLYEGTPRSSSLAKDRKANAEPRIFARALSLMLDFSSSNFERILVDALNAMDLCTHKSRHDNHLFLNLVSDYENTVIDPVVVEQVVVEILKRHSERVSGLGIIEVETRIVCCLSASTPPIAIRLFASNPTGFVHVMNTYVEASSDRVDDRVFKLISGTKASLASAGDSSWDGLKINTPYPLTRPFDAQRKVAFLSSDTIYCYDLPALFEAAVEKQWLETRSNIAVDGGGVSGRPLMVMFTTELVVQKKGGVVSDKWTMKDYLNGDLELVNVSRRAGLNDVGMVAWAVTLKTVEYPNVS